MKKLLILFLFAGLVFSTTSCKKKESCPEPEKPKGIGTWKVTSVKYDDGTLITDSSEQTCLKASDLVLGEDQKSGSWAWTFYSEYSSNCQSVDLQVTSWAENFSQKRLYITASDGTDSYAFGFDFVDETHLKQTRLAGINAAGDDYIFVEFQYEKQ